MGAVNGQQSVLRLQHRYRDMMDILVRAPTQILESLSTAPMVTLSPVMIARDPLYTVPLAGNARYKALQAKLEAQMAATKLE